MLCPGCGRNIINQTGLCPLCGSALDPLRAAAMAAMPVGKAQEAAPSEPLIPAGFWRRFFAYSLDLIPIGLISGLLLLVSGTPIEGGRFADSGWGLWFLSWGIWLLYFALLESSQFKATPGKAFMQAYVTDLEGRRISFGRALGRAFGRILSMAILGIGFVMAAFTENKRALHDYVGGTRVCRLKDATPGRFILGAILSFVLPAVISVAIAIGSVFLNIGVGTVRSTTRAIQHRSQQGNPTPVAPEIEIPVLVPPTVPQEVEPPQPVAPSVNQAFVGPKEMEFKGELAISKPRAGTIEIGLYRNEISEGTAASIGRSGSLVGGERPTPDLIVSFKFKYGATGCSAEMLSSYVITFKGNPGGFVLPGGRPEVEFARAVTSERTREGIAIGCVPAPDSSIVVSMRGTGGAPGSDGVPPFRWNLAFKAPLFEMP